MAAALEGSTHLTGTTTATGSNSVTIPAAATYAIVFCVGYTGSGFNVDSITIDGQAAATVMHDIADSVEGDSSLYAAEYTGFSTGAGKTIAWDFSTAPGDGAVIGIAWYSDAKLGNYGRHIGDSASETASINLSVTAGSLAYIFGASYTSEAVTNVAPASSDQTQVSAGAAVNGEDCKLGVETTLDTPTTTMTATGGFLVAFAFEIQTSGGAPPAGIKVGSLMMMGAGR